MSEQTLLLVGAGHAHLGVIDDVRQNGAPCSRIVLIEPREAMHYSGMVPGWLAGEYRASEAMIPLQPLVEECGLEWHKAAATGIDAANRVIHLDTGEELNFDICSIAIGGSGRAARILGRDDRLLDIRPIDRFVDKWRDLRDGEAPPRRIAVVGGGAGGVELAFGFANSPHVRPSKVCIVTGKGGLLPDHEPAVRRKTRRELQAQGVTILEEDARIEAGELRAAERSLEPLDLIVAAIGSAAAEWPKASGLPVDQQGFIKVDEHQRVLGLPHIFAAGDTASRMDRDLPHSGVHAVYAGPVLARNLRAALAGKPVRGTYLGRGMNFYLLNTCRGEAILSYGPFALKGRWLRRLKDWLDRRWIDRFSR